MTRTRKKELKRKKLKFKIEEKILKEISKVLNTSGFESYLVGGYIRDRLLGKISNDIDIMVIGDGIKAAHTVAKIFKKKLSAVYKKFRTALLNIDAYKIEFASARKESYKKHSRKPDIKLANLQEDLSRRDFTVNALAVSLKNGKLIDLFDSLKDLEKKIIRTPLEPHKTFDDDPLRILRAIRFASTLQFRICDETFEAIRDTKHRLVENHIVSQERITNELMLILSSSKPSIGFNLLHSSGILEIIFPELEKLSGVEQKYEYHHKDVFNHTLQVLDNVSAVSDNIWLRFAALVHDIAKPNTKSFDSKAGWTFYGHNGVGAKMMGSIFKKLRLPTSKLIYIQNLIRLHLRPIPLAQEEVTDSAIRRLIVDAGDYLDDLLILCRADITSKNIEKMKKFLKNYDKVEKRIIEVKEKDRLRNFQSPVRGEEIMKICNLEPSKKVGIIKKKIEDAILEGIIPNEYEAARQYLEKIKNDILNQDK